MPIEEKETSDAVLDKVAKMYPEAGANIPNKVVDRAYRIHILIKILMLNVKGSKCVRHRTMVYRVKRKVKSDVRIELNLTKSRDALLNNASKVVKLRDLNSAMKTLIFDSNQSGLICLHCTKNEVFH